MCHCTSRPCPPQADAYELPNWRILRFLSTGPERELALHLLSESSALLEDASRSCEVPGEVYALCDPGARGDEAPDGVAVVRPIRGENAVELGGLATRRHLESEQLASRMLADLLDALRARGVRVARAVVTNGDASRRALLVQAGFQPVADGRPALEGRSRPQASDRGDVLTYELEL